jgi:hypothetical protein
VRITSSDEFDMPSLSPQDVKDAVQAKALEEDVPVGAGVGAGASVSYDEVQRTRELLLTQIALYGYTMTQVIQTKEWSGAITPKPTRSAFLSTSVTPS